MQPDTRTIPLTQGRVALVSASDFDWLSQWKWCANNVRGGIRAQRTERSGGAQHSILMARFILNAPAGAIVDHINRDTLDNRRENLRLCTLTGNARNRTSAKGATSAYLGVHWCSTNGKWAAGIKAAGKRYHLGLFLCEQSAARAYDKAAIELHGAFAHPNFPA